MKTELVLRAKHFKNNNFWSCSLCPIAEAAKEKFKTQAVMESIHSLSVKGATYIHESYDPVNFDDDMKIARKSKFGNKIIRRIELIKEN